MNKETDFRKSKYKEIYRLVKERGYEPEYLRQYRGLYILGVYPKDYILSEDKYYRIETPVLLGLEELKKEIMKLSSQKVKSEVGLK